MAANDPHPQAHPPAAEDSALAVAAMRERLAEEVNRAERHGTQLSCLLVVIDNRQEISEEHGSELSEQTLTYVGEALRPELRSFDRIGRPSDGELLIVLPGTDGPRGEMVARRVLERLRAIKVEAEGTRRPLRFSVGLASWQKDTSPEQLLARMRAATRTGNGNGNGNEISVERGGPEPTPPVLDGPTRS